MEGEGSQPEKQFSECERGAAVLKMQERGFYSNGFDNNPLLSNPFA